MTFIYFFSTTMPSHSFILKKISVVFQSLYIFASDSSSSSYLYVNANYMLIKNTAEKKEFKLQFDAGFSVLSGAQTRIKFFGTF